MMAAELRDDRFSSRGDVGDTLRCSIGEAFTQSFMSTHKQLIGTKPEDKQPAIAPWVASEMQVMTDGVTLLDITLQGVAHCKASL